MIIKLDPKMKLKMGDPVMLEMSVYGKYHLKRWATRNHVGGVVAEDITEPQVAIIHTRHPTSLFLVFNRSTYKHLERGESDG